eukprot:jgi/Mesen1/10341/ME000008S10121
MRRGGGRRPDGTDGSDHSFRMTIDNRYKVIADTKRNLKRLIVAQGMFVVVRSAFAVVDVRQGRQVEPEAALMLLFTAAASLTGALVERPVVSEGSEDFSAWFRLLVGVCQDIVDEDGWETVRGVW